MPLLRSNKEIGPFEKKSGKSEVIVSHFQMQHYLPAPPHRLLVSAFSVQNLKIDGENNGRKFAVLPHFQRNTPDGLVKQVF